MRPQKHGRIRRGLVLGGGGSLGAYQAGVLRALHEAKLDFEVISATSIGTINGLAWNMKDVLETLDEHWIENVARLRPFDLSRALRGANPFQFHASLDEITRTYSHRYPFDDERSEVLVTLTTLDTNERAVFSSQDETFSTAEKEKAMKASTAILHIGSAPVEIRGRKYFDGGYTDNVPVEPLLGRALDEIWLIPLGRMDLVKTSARLRAALRWGKRALPSPYIRSTLSLLEQCGAPLVNPGCEAQTFIISPHPNDAPNPIQLRDALSFSLSNIRKQILAGYGDGRRQLDMYLRGRAASHA